MPRGPRAEPAPRRRGMPVPEVCPTSPIQLPAIRGLPLAAGRGFGYKNRVFRSFGGPDGKRIMRMT